MCAASWRRSASSLAAIGTRATQPRFPSFAPLTTALSGTVGVGNIAGVAVAISMGGPGATFWLIVAGVLGMSTEVRRVYVERGVPTQECRRQLLRRPDVHLGTRLGRAAVAAPRQGPWASSTPWRWWSAAWGSATCTNPTRPRQWWWILAGSAWLADNVWLVGAVLALLVALVIIGGIKSIAK